MLPDRIEWSRGHYARVDGIPYNMPVAAKGSPLMWACFSCDAEKARAILPGKELHPLRVWNRAVLALQVVNYLETTIGRYVEFSVGILCTRGRRPAPRLLPAIFMKWFGTGQYIYDLPVSSEISVKGGLGIWGMAKRQANLDFVIGSEWVSSQYDLDGELVFRLDVKRPGRAWFPARIKGVGYGAFRGMMTKSYVYLKGKTGLTLGSGGARLLLGDHERAGPIRALDVEAEPFASGFFPSTLGWLDDHIETWFLLHDRPPAEAATGIRDVVDLTISEEWLAPPDRRRSDRLMEQAYPASAASASVDGGATVRSIEEQRLPSRDRRAG